MDWLEEIEKDYKVLREEGLLKSDEEDIERMARVLRELAEELYKRMEGYEINDLSGDAMELLSVAASKATRTRTDTE